MVEINRRVTGNSAPKSDLDIDYHRVMPIHSTFGQIVNVKRTLTTVSDISDTKVIYSNCPFARRGYNGQYILLPQDVASRDPITGEPTWKIYTNPTTGEQETFPWTSIVSYDDFPWRCGNGQCVSDEYLCSNSAKQFPVCNGNGLCRADGSCECFPGFKTFQITDKYTSSISFPYNIERPTDWELNWNWLHHSLDQCTIQECSDNQCEIPKGCNTGTFELDFEDRDILCDFTTGNEGKCAPSKNHCLAGRELSEQLECSGNGIVI